MQKRNRRARKSGERGASLAFLGVSLIALLAVMALAIDLGILYVGRSEAQRAADAAALAGAYRFSQSSCTAPGGNCAADTFTQNAALQQAQHVADSNYVLSQQVSLSPADVTFTYPQPSEPQVTVTVRRSNVSLIFARVFGRRTGNVSAAATAEATQANSVGCVVPFLMADCNPVKDLWSAQSSNPACPVIDPTTGTKAYYFIDPTTGQADDAVIGKSIVLHTTTSGGGTPVPSQWYLAGISVGGTGTPSGNLLRNNIEHCSYNAVTCGDNNLSIPSIPGNKVGPVVEGVNTLINASGDGPGNGQDSLLSVSPDGTYEISPGGSLSAPASYGPSRSIITVPLFSGVNGQNTTTLSEGNQNTVTVVGFAQLFINYVASPGLQQTLPAPCDNIQGPFDGSPVCVTVLKITGCSGGNINSGSSPVPVRLIQGPG